MVRKVWIAGGRGWGVGTIRRGQKKA